MRLRRARVVGGGDRLHEIEIDGGMIVAVRPEPDGPERAGGPILDLDGRWVMPGLWDHHVHFQQWSITRARFDLSGAGSAAAAAASAGRELATRPDHSDVFVGIGFRDAMWPDPPPTTQLLDRQTGNTPAVLISADLHTVWLNTAARQRFDPDGSGGGVLREQDAFAVQRALAELAPERADQLVAAAATAAATRGVVGIVDFEFFDIGPTWQRRIANGTTALRVACSVWPQAVDAVIARGHRSGDVLPGTGGRATMGPLKVIIDGSLNTRTACCFDPYPDPAGADPYGLLTVSPADLLELLVTAKRTGLDAAVHAIGDRANSVALDAYERAGFQAPRRGSIEHAQLVTAPDRARMARLGLVASVQPEHAVDDRDVADRYWAGRTADAFAYRSLLEAGVELALGSDAPVAPLDPWISIAAAVHRTGDEREPWHPEQRITIGSALRASTHGLIEAGAVADLVALDRDPLTASADDLRRLPVAATMLGGAWTHLQIG